jgi:hypothetical protein
LLAAEDGGGNPTAAHGHVFIKSNIDSGAVAALADLDPVAVRQTEFGRLFWMQREPEAVRQRRALQ